MGEDTTLSKEMGVTPTRSSNKERGGQGGEKGVQEQQRTKEREEQGGYIEKLKEINRDVDTLYHKRLKTSLLMQKGVDVNR